MHVQCLKIINSFNKEFIYNKGFHLFQYNHQNNIFKLAIFLSTNWAYEYNSIHHTLKTSLIVCKNQLKNL